MVESSTDAAAREDFRANLADIRGRIAAAAARSGRSPDSVHLMAVTKTFPRQSVEMAMAEGLLLFGENRVQEAEQKYLDLPGGWELHLIGHLQRNKARAASALFHCVQSIDKPETAEALDARCAERGTIMDVLLELNTSGEPSKSGFHSPDELRECLRGFGAHAHLRPRGLMTVGPLGGDPGRIRAAFAALRGLFDDVRSSRSFPCFDILSMGMSGDFEIAIEEGATLVRLGTALFGRRTAP